MDVQVHSVSATPWLGDDGYMFKRIEAETTLGQRRHEVSFSLCENIAGEKGPIFTLTFNFGLMPPQNLDGGWAVVRLRGQTSNGAQGTFQAIEKNDLHALFCRDRDDIAAFITSFLSDENWTAEVCGPEGVIFEFPIPGDASFKDAVERNRGGPKSSA